MNQALLTSQLTDWLTEFVEVPNPLLNNWAPCPFARQARIKNKIAVVFCEVDKITNAVDEAKVLFPDKEVVAILFDHTKISGTQLAELVVQINDKIMSENFVILEDHPDTPELLHNVAMNFGKCGLILMSPLRLLNDASEQIRAKGYYDHWPQENIDNVVAWRFK
jgi:hypothetical protein